MNAPFVPPPSSATSSSTTSSASVSSLPGPGGSLPTLLRLARDPYRFYDEQRRRYGDRFRVGLPRGWSALVTSRASDLSAVFGADADTFERQSIPLRPLLGDDNLLTLQGDAHRRRKQRVIPCLSGPRLAALGERMLDAAHRRIGGWREGQRTPLLSEMAEITMDVMVGAVFGMDTDQPRHQAFKRLIRRTMNAVTPMLLVTPWLRVDLGPLSPWGRYVRAKQATDAALLEEIEEVRRSPQRGAQADLLAWLSAPTDDGEPALDPATILGELYGVLLVSYENVANHLSWAWWLLDRHPAFRARLLEELDGAADTRALGIARLPLLDAVVREVLRLLPPSETYRRCARPLALDGLTLAPGDVVMPAIYLVHTDADRYAAPHTFDPDRWLDERASTVGAHDFLTFGAGARRCPAQAFGMMEIKLILAATLQRASWTLLRPEQVKARRRRIATVPACGLPAQLDRVSPRRPTQRAVA